MLRASGVPELEARVMAFLYENSAGLKLMATLDDAGRLLAEVGGRGGGGGVGVGRRRAGE